MLKGAIVSHSGSRCGVHQYGRRLFSVLAGGSPGTAPMFDWRYVECDDSESFRRFSASEQQDFTIFNAHPCTMPWADDPDLHGIGGRSFAILHEVYQQAADALERGRYDFFLCPDPTLVVSNDVTLPIPRFIPRKVRRHPIPPEVFTIGSFGFATRGKGFGRLCAAVNDQFDTARIRINIPHHDSEDIVSSEQMAQVVQDCRSRIIRPGIELIITNDFLDDRMLLRFLNQNTINAFLYEDQEGRGIASCIDYALATQVPLAISRSRMFRHLHDLTPSICYEDEELRAIADRGYVPVQRLARANAAGAARKSINRIISGALESWR